MTACPACRKEAPDGSRFCPFCGGKLASQDQKPQDPLVGRLIAEKYAVKRWIASGAMGKIYLAEHLALGKPVVLKVLHRHLLVEEDQVKRFHREAKAASRLNHPNAISMLDFGQTEDGLFYIAMEYLPGRDLCRVLSDEVRLSLDRTVRIVDQILEALEEAHAVGVVHRDLKPENVMIEDLRSRQDFVKVLDFGIAKIRDTSGEGGISSFKTATGMVFGTPEYMSPEQIRGDELDGRSDLYSLGILMYQMLSGTLPFEGESVLEVATAHLQQPPPPLQKRAPGIPAPVVAFVDRLLQKKREDRFQSAAEARKALQEAWEAARPRPVAPVDPSEVKTVLVSTPVEEAAPVSPASGHPPSSHKPRPQVPDEEPTGETPPFEVVTGRDSRWKWIGWGALLLVVAGGVLLIVGFLHGRS
ncbi:protein kinase [Myxococcota bacterium]|nr:protein kinase [Myxococcota bacterium]